MSKWIRDDLKDFVPYCAEVTSHRLKLDANESPFGLISEVLHDTVHWLSNYENLNLYPDSDCIELRKSLAKFWNVDMNNIVCGVGSDQIIDYITKVYLQPGDFIVVPKPTFSMYGISARINHGKVIEVDLCNDFSYNIEKIIEACNNKNVVLLFLTSPNNPTGSSLSTDEIEFILKSVDCPVVVDEAYGEFSGISVIPIIKDYHNLIVLRTFSKAYGLAGIRVGYAIADIEIINDIEKVRAPYNLSTISQFIANSVLNYTMCYAERVECLMNAKKELEKELNNFGCFTVYPSDANFIFIESDINIYDDLKNSGILIRRMGISGNGKNLFRITASIPSENRILVEAISKILSSS